MADALLILLLLPFGVNIDLVCRVRGHHPPSTSLDGEYFYCLRCQERLEQSA